MKSLLMISLFTSVALEAQTLQCENHDQNDFQQIEINLSGKKVSDFTLSGSGSIDLNLGSCDKEKKVTVCSNYNYRDFFDFSIKIKKKAVEVRDLNKKREFSFSNCQLI